MPEGLMLKTYDAEIKEVEGERALNVTITTPDVDRDGDIVEPKGAKLVNYRKNPVVLMAHDYRGLPIGKAKDLDKTDTGINAKVIFPEEGTYPLADTVYNLYKQKFMKAWSIGFIPIKTEDIVDEDEDKVAEHDMRRGKRIKTWELLEFSACAVPSNPDALSNMMEKGINIDTLKEAGFVEIEEERSVIPYKETPKAPEGGAWDAGAEVKKASGNATKLKTMHTWVDSGADNFDADERQWYKLPHHKGDGAQAVVWRGVAAAMGALLGARGGVAVPAGDKKGIYNHLIKHYKQFDKEPPEFRDYSEEEIKELFEEEGLKDIGLFDIKELAEIVNRNKELVNENKGLKEKNKELELKAGAVLNSKNKKDLKDAQALIQSVLDSAEVSEDSLEIEDEKDSKDDDLVIELEDSKEDGEGIDEKEDKKTIEVDEEVIDKVMDKVMDDQMGYLVGKVKQSDTKNKIEKRGENK